MTHIPFEMIILVATLVFGWIAYLSRSSAWKAERKCFVANLKCHSAELQRQQKLAAFWQSKWDRLRNAAKAKGFLVHSDIDGRVDLLAVAKKKRAKAKKRHE